jgi:ankyrin repeat protein
MGYYTKLISTLCLAVLVALIKLQAGEIQDAAAAGDLNKVKALLEADSTLLESRDNDGNTPLIIACFAPLSDYFPRTAVANFLIDKGADIKAKNNWGGTPLYLALKDLNLVKRLIDLGADVNAKAFNNITPLQQATSIGNLEVAKLLIEHGADINARTTEGTVLQSLIKKKGDSSSDMVKLLLESGAKLQEFSFGNTELHLAALIGASNIAQLLIEHGANINAKNDYGHTALYYAARHGYRNVADVLIAMGANKSDIVETNYGKAPQLTENLKEGEAYLWFLGGISPGTGYAIKTRKHLLIFDPCKISASPDTGLTKGYINPSELVGQKITIMLTRPTRYVSSVSELKKQIPDASFVFSFKPTNFKEDSNVIFPYHFAVPNESFSIGGNQVHTIRAMGQTYIEKINCLGYLVETDGVKVFHVGLHASGNGVSQMDKYRKEIDFLKPFGPIDIAILPIKGRHINIAYEPYLYLIDQLSPKAIYLIGDDFNTEEHLRCIDVLRARNVPVYYPEGGLAVGERFHYLSNSTQK